MAVIRHAKPGRKGTSAWLLGLLERKPRKLAAVALANKTARIVWPIDSCRWPPEPRLVAGL
jgi:transposase